MNINPVELHICNYNVKLNEIPSVEIKKKEKRIIIT